MILAIILVVPENPRFMANISLFLLLVIVTVLIIRFATRNTKRKHNRHED